MRSLKCLRHATLAAGCALPLAAEAHGASVPDQWWVLDPWLWLPLIAFAILYLRGMSLLRAQARTNGRTLRVLDPLAGCAFWAAIAALFLALIWPLEALSGVSFAAHMTQHMILIAVAAPLLVYAEPSLPLVRALPFLGAVARGKIVKRALRIALMPRFAFALHAALIWFWHAPFPYELALRNDAMHVLEHLSFFGSGILFWAALRQAGRAGGSGYGQAALWTLGTLMHTGILGALITFSPRLLYSVYADIDLGWLTPLEDQQLAGLVMWVPGGLLYLVVGLGFVVAWLNDAGRHSARIG
jgi:putative membrane protein